jgi:hypothetical protein
VFERLLGFGRNRRLAKDYESLAASPTAFVMLASIQTAIARPARGLSFGSALTTPALPGCAACGIKAERLRKHGTHDLVVLGLTYSLGL